MKNHTSSLLHTRTRLQAGNAASDICYVYRNKLSIQCGILGWPQSETFSDGSPNICRGNANELILMHCLQDSGETNWWKDFANCTSAEQCLALASEKDNKMIAKL